MPGRPNGRALPPDIGHHHLENLQEVDEEDEEEGEGHKGSALLPARAARAARRAADLEDDQVYLDEQFSVGGLPPDLPSGLVDIEGNVLIDVQIGQEEDFEDEDRIESAEGYEIEGAGRAPSVLGEPVRRLSVISNGKVFSHGRGYHLHDHPSDRRLQALMGRNNSTSAQSNVSTSSTIQQHYYPEGGWGWVVLAAAVCVHVLMCGLCLSAGVVIWAIVGRYARDLSERDQVKVAAGWYGSTSMAISLLLSPLWVAICKRKSTRLTAVFGGLVAALGCLFTSFATQLHQVFFSYGTILGIGVGLTRDAAGLMVGQYFRKKRDLVEVVLVAASGLGMMAMSALVNYSVSVLGWRIGLQAVTGCLFFCFFLGTCYRSASLYHPQRRAILHLKNQKRKIKEKEKRHSGPPFIDWTCLRSKTVQILLVSSSLSAFGVYVPLFFLATDFVEAKDQHTFDHLTLPLLYVYVGASWIVGCVMFGLLVVQQSKDCRVSKQYLCQIAGVLCGISVGMYSVVEGQNGLLIFCSVYGFFLGGYQYSLKVHTFERVRARHFPRAWAFIQSGQALPLFFGVPLTGYLNSFFDPWKPGYYVAGAAVCIGSLLLFLTDVRKRRMSRRKSANSSTKTCETPRSLASRTTSTALSSISTDKTSSASSSSRSTDVRRHRDRGRFGLGRSPLAAVTRVNSDSSGFESAATTKSVLSSSSS